MWSEATASGMLADSRIGVASAKKSDCEDIPDVTGSGGEEGAGTGVDLQKDRLRMDPSPTITLDRGLRA